MKKGERRKQDLLNIAYRMFIEKGYENTSVDDIIIEAGIAKGTYYYYFESKEATLEAVIEMMIEKAENIAKAALMNPVPIPQKLASVVYAFQPNKDEIVITDVLERKENIVMHDKIGKKIVEVAVPILPIMSSPKSLNFRLFFKFLPRKTEQKMYDSHCILY